MDSIELNCWEFMKCNETSKQKCPAFQNNEGKICWIVTGTLCKGKNLSSMFEKLKTCHACEFYKSRKGVPV